MKTSLMIMSRCHGLCFNIWLVKVKSDLQKQDTRWRKALTPEERLVVCFRYENKN
jgi:hypothetical protein